MFKQITVKGNRYEMGYQLGVYFKDLINADIKKYEDLLKDENIKKEFDKVLIKLENEYPLALEELKGKADGAWVNQNALILMHYSELYKKPLGCTTAIYKKDDRVYFSHNEDEQGYDDNNSVLCRYEYDDHFIVSLTLYNQLTGSCFGYNSYGLVFSCNYLFHDEENLNNISRYILSRELIESKSINEVIDILNKNKPAQPFSFNVLNIHTNKVINIEIDFNKLNITNIDKKFSRSNHFLTKENAKMSENSKYRNIFAKKGMDELSDNPKLDDIYKVLCYEDEEYVKSILMDPVKYKDIDNSITLCNFTFDSYTKEIKIHDYIDHSLIEYREDF